MLVERRAPSDEGDTPRGAGEGDGHELGETARLRLDRAELTQVGDAFLGRLDVAVEEDARRPEPGAVRGRDPVDPAVDLEVARRDQRANPFAEDLDPRAGDRVDAGVPECGQGPVEPEATTVGEVADVLRPIRVDMDARGRRLHGAHDLEVGRRGLVLGQQSLDAQLRRTQVPRVGGDRGGVVERERRRVGGRPRTEAGRGEVPVDDEADGLAHGVAPHVVGGRGERIEVGALGPQEASPVGVVQGERVGCRGLGQAGEAARLSNIQENSVRGSPYGGRRDSFS